MHEGRLLVGGLSLRIIHAILALLLLLPAAFAGAAREDPPFTVPVGARDALLLRADAAALEDAREILRPVFETTGVAGIVPPQDQGGARRDFRAHLPARADLDGDGRDDLFRVEIAREGGGILSSSIVALAGPSGAPHWRFDQGAGVQWSAYLPGDVTGDGLDDVVLLTNEDRTVVWSFPPRGISCIECVGYSYVATTRLIVIDGATGDERWSEARSVRYLYAQAMLPQILAVLHLGHFGDRFGVLAAADDLDGDGASDLLWQSWEATLTDAKSSQVTSVAARSGATGAPLWDATLVGGATESYNLLLPTVAGAWSGPDGNGDGVGDVYTSEIQTTPIAGILTQKGLDGRTGLPFWVAASAFETNGDHLGGGYLTAEGDGLLWTLGNFPARVASLDPASGMTRWSHIAPNAAGVQMTPDATGDGLGDVLLIEADGLALTLRLLDGASGAQAWTRAFAGQIGGRSLEYALVFPSLGDHDGDGMPEVVVLRGAQGSAGWLRSDETDLVDLAHGQSHWRQATVDVIGSSIRFPMPDVNGNGRPDIGYLRASSWKEPIPTIDARAYDGGTGALLWHRDGHRTGTPEETAWAAGFGFAGDLDGDGAGDLFVVSLDLAAPGSGFADGISGADGSLLTRLATDA